MVQFGKRYTYEEIMDEIYGLKERWPQLLTVEEAGISHDERCIPGILIGDNRECLICSAGIHGRESVNPILLLRMVEDYCQRWEEEPLLRRYGFYVLPILNPDGYEVALRGFQALRSPILRHAMRMRNQPHETWKCNGRGVDINRNFPCSSYLPGNGSWYPASENETKALMDVFQKFPDSVGYIDFHSRGRIIYYYRSAMTDSYNQKSARFAKTLQELSNYDLGTWKDERKTKSDGGNSVHYYSERYERPALTVETVEDEAGFPLDASYQQKTYEEIWRLPLAYLEEYDKTEKKDGAGRSCFFESRPV